MKFDFESLSTEPLFYMLMHSGAFVCVLGAIFFIIGLLFGYATWGRYKRQTRQLLGEASLMKDEIASLKRKVGELSILPGPAVSMATEVIYMPRKAGAPAAEAVPAVTEETSTTRDLPTTAPEPIAPAVEAAAPESVQTPAPLPTVPSEPAAEPSPPAPHASPLAAIISAPHKEEAQTGADTSAAPAGMMPADSLPALTELLLPALPELDSHPKPEAILEAKPELKSEAIIEAKSEPTPETELETKSEDEAKLEPKSETKPDSEIDPKLGFIYKSRPEKTDDLTALNGVAPVLEKRLHDFGIYTYAQIAAWDEDLIKEFSARLAFKDRIQRENWVEQARQLASNPVAA